MVKAAGSTRRTRPASVPGPPQFTIATAAPGRISTASVLSTSTTISMSRGSPISMRGEPGCTIVSLSCGTRSTRPATGAVTFQAPTRRRRRRVPREQRARLIELVLGRVIEEFRRAQIAIGHALGERGALERLRGRRTALGQRLRAGVVGFRLPACARARSPAALARSSVASAAPSRSSASRRLRGSSSGAGDGTIVAMTSSSADLVAGLEPDAREPPGERRRHDVALADARLAVLLDGGDEASLGHRCATRPAPAAA